MSKNQQPARRDTYWKRCEGECKGAGYVLKTNASTGNVYRENCKTCQGAGGATTPVGQ